MCLWNSMRWIPTWCSAHSSSTVCLFLRMLQGLWERDPDGLSALKSMPLGIIRGGTSNGLFATILVRVSMPRLSHS